MFVIICFGNVDELDINMFCLLVLVIKIGLLFVCVICFLINFVILVELVNIMLLKVCCINVVFKLFVLSINCNVFFGMFVWCKSFIVVYVIREVCFVGLVIIVFFVVRFVVICLVKIVKGKF